MTRRHRQHARRVRYPEAEDAEPFRTIGGHRPSLQEEHLLRRRGRRYLGRSSLIQAAPLQERRHVRIAAGEVTEEFHDVIAASAREQCLAEVIAVLALEAAVLLDPLDAVGIEHF